MEDNNSSYSKGFLIGAVVGGAVGAVVALLFAPKSGRELRRDIADRTEEVVDKAQQMFNNATSGGQESRSGLDDVVNEGRIAAERIVSTVESMQRDVHQMKEQALPVLAKTSEALDRANTSLRKLEEQVNTLGGGVRNIAAIADDVRELEQSLIARVRPALEDLASLVTGVARGVTAFARKLTS